MESVGRLMMVLGVVFVVIGALLWANPTIPILGKLPGDISIERPGVRIHFPITTATLLSLGITALLQLFSRPR